MKPKDLRGGDVSGLEATQRMIGGGTMLIMPKMELKQLPGCLMFPRDSIQCYLSGCHCHLQFDLCQIPGPFESISLHLVQPTLLLRFLPMRTPVCVTLGRPCLSSQTTSCSHPQRTSSRFSQDHTMSKQMMYRRLFMSSWCRGHHLAD